MADASVDAGRPGYDELAVLVVELRNENAALRERLEELERKVNRDLADLVTREPKHAGEHRDVRVQPGPEPRPGTRRQRRERRALTRRAAQPHPRMLEHQRDDRRQLELLIDDRIADPFLAAIKHVPATTAVRQMLKTGATAPSVGEVRDVAG